MVVVGVGMVDLLFVVAGSVPAGGCELSVRARRRGGRPRPPNRGGTAEFGQRYLGVSSASRSVERHRRLRDRTAPGLLEGSPGAWVAGESVIARHPTPLASPGTGGLVATWNVAVVSHGPPLVVVMAPHGEQADPGRIWTSVLAVLCVAGGRARASTRRTWGSGPKIDKRSSRTLVAFSGGQGSVRASLPMNRQLRADRRQTFSDQLRLTTTAPDARGRERANDIGDSFSSWVPTTGRQRAKGPV